MSNLTTKISGLTITGNLSEGVLVPIVSGGNGTKSTQKTNLQTLRQAIGFSNAYATAAAGISGTTSGDVFYVYTDSNNEFVLGYTNQNGVGSTPLLDSNGNQVKLPTQKYLSSFPAVDGFRSVGQVASYADLKTIVPKYAGQSILLKSFYSDWATSGRAPKGGGEFVAVAIPSGTTITDDGGSIATVNASWYWLRIVDEYYSPEMFGAYGDGSADDAPAIRAAINASATAALHYVKGTGIYKVATQIYLISGYNASPTAGLLARTGATLYLNVVIVDPTKWPAVPAKWWDAAAVFIPPSNVEIEAYDLRVNQLDCGGVASGISTTNSAINTSELYIGNMRNYIVGFKNYLGQIFSSGMSKVYGKNWQDGYIGILHGGQGNGTGNGECQEININWCSNNRYGGILFLDRSQYSEVEGGTYDYNGKWASVLTLSNYTDTNPYSIEFGATVTIGSKTCFALTSIMNNNGDQVLMVTESADKIDGTSDYNVGDTITVGTWTATISAIQLTSAINPYYFDIIICNRTGDFSKLNVFSTYLGGYKGHNLFTNVIICLNSVATTSTVNFRGMGLTGDVNQAYMHFEHLYGTYPAIQFYKDKIVPGKDLELGYNAIRGNVIAFNAVTGTPVNIATFPAPASALTPTMYKVQIGTSQPGQWALMTVIVYAATITVIESTLAFFTIPDPSGLTLAVTINGSNALITVTTTRVL